MLGNLKIEILFGKCIIVGLEFENVIIDVEIRLYFI